MSTPHSVLRFGAYRIDLAARELHHAGRLLALSPKMFDGLAWLLAHRERAVGRDELGAAVWGRTDVTDAQIDQLIRKLRRALGDTGSEQEIIRTIPRYGYRFVAEVRPESDEPPAAAEAAPSVTAPVPEAVQASGAPVPPLVSTPRARLALVAAVLVAALVAAAVLVASRPGERAPPTEMASGTSDGPAEAAPRAPLVAVLPVAVDSAADGEWSWLRLGLMDLIGSRLRDAGLTVVPADNVLAMLRTGEATRVPEPDQVRAATGARYVVAPALRRVAGGWRLHIDLADADGAAREVEAHADEAPDSARMAADRVLVLLGHAPGEGEDREAPTSEDLLVSRIDAAIYGRDYDAAQHLVEGAPQALRMQPRLRLREAEIARVAGDAERAMALFQAVLDSDTAAAPLDVWTHADALHGLVVILNQARRPEEAMARLDEMVELARRHDIPLIYGRALLSRGALHTMARREGEADGDFAQAHVALELAGDTLGLARLEANQAANLILRRRYVEAQALLDRAVPRLERFAPSETLLSAYGNLIHMHLSLLEPARALAVAERARAPASRLDSAHPRRLLMRQEARALLASGRHAEAAALLDRLLAEVDPEQTPDLFADTILVQAQLALASGHADEAARLSAQALERLSAPALAAPMPSRGRATAWLVRVRALRGLGDMAGAAAEQARFAAWAAGSDDSAIGVLAGLSRAEQAEAEARPEASAVFEADLALARERAAPADLAQVAIAYGDHLLDAGRFEEAARVIGQTAAWAGQDFDCALAQVRLYHALGQTGSWRQALAQARALAGERRIPAALAQPPSKPDRSQDWPAAAETPPRIAP